jgi:methanogenic corrinoid protein MtbC1
VIAELRRHSKNRRIGIMVGGPMFAANPNLAIEIGADATAVNAPAAVIVAQRLFDAAELEESWPPATLLDR